LRLQVLGSGSQGNATLVEFGGTRILVDAGLSARQLALRLEAINVPPQSIDCILLTHEHQDHARGAERFSNKYRVPVACSRETLEAMDLSPVHLAQWLDFPTSGSLDLGQVKAESFPVPHDAAQPVGFVLGGEGLRVGVATDLGHATTVVRQHLKGCHVMMIESNHDEAMLRDGPYPWHLKQRVRGRRGHLSNDESAGLLRDTLDGCCRAVVLAHLSAKNNTQSLARGAAARAIQATGAKRVEMRVAMIRTPTPAVEL